MYGKYQPTAMIFKEINQGINERTQKSPPKIELKRQMRFLFQQKNLDEISNESVDFLVTVPEIFQQFVIVCYFLVWSLCGTFINKKESWKETRPFLPQCRHPYLKKEK